MIDESNTRSFGTIVPVEVRTLWPNEARDFTPWLAMNLARLGEALGMDLELTAMEQDVGDFSLDLLAKDLGSGRPVIIENQLGPTDHDHLGKLITYAAGTDAGAVIWLTETVRDEHRQAMEWLNRRTDADIHFFSVTVEVFRIDDSRPAVSFKPVVYPNEWQRAAHETADRQSSERGEAYRAYFQRLIDELREEHRFTGARTGQPQNWYLFAAGYPGVGYGHSFAAGGRVRAELYIQRKDKSLFDSLSAQKEAIDREFGTPLEWDRLEEKQACRVAIYREGKIGDPEQRLAEIRAWAVMNLLRLKKVFGPRLNQLSAPADPA